MSFSFSLQLCSIVSALMHCLCGRLELELHVETEGDDLRELSTDGWAFPGGNEFFIPMRI